MFYVYVLRSLKTGRRYTGQTNNLAERLKQHNGGFTKSTRTHAPFKLEYSEIHQSRHEAMEREHWLKTGAGRDWLDRQQR